MANKRRKSGALLMATTLVGTAAGTMTSSNTASASSGLLNKLRNSWNNSGLSNRMRNSWNSTGDKLLSAVDDAFEGDDNTLSVKAAKGSLKTVAALMGTIGFICHFTISGLVS